VTGVRRDAQIAVVIEDQGIGIPESEQEQVFERYYRGSNTTGIVGSGVGLYLVKTIIELHKGSVALNSREGEGSQFTVQLPALTAQVRTLCTAPECEAATQGSAFS
jgi:signal transduction histidine kinase